MLSLHSSWTPELAFPLSFTVSDIESAPGWMSFLPCVCHLWNACLPSHRILRSNQFLLFGKKFKESLTLSSPSNVVENNSYNSETNLFVVSLSYSSFHLYLFPSYYILKYFLILIFWFISHFETPCLWKHLFIVSLFVHFNGLAGFKNIN